MDRTGARTTGVSLILIMAFAFLVRVAAIFLLGRHTHPDTWEYDILALNMLHGKGYLIEWLGTEYRSFCYPAYPMITALSHLLTGQNYVILELAHAALSAGSCYLVYLITSKMFDRRSALVSACLMALHPGLIVYATKLHELTLAVFLALLIFWVMIAGDRSRPSTSLWLGALAGFGILTRTTFIFFLPVFAVYMVASQERITIVVRHTLLACLLCAVVITPWTIRNFMIHERFIFIITSSAEVFWRGNNPSATGTSYTSSNIPMIDGAPKEFLTQLYSLGELGQSDLFYRTAISYIRNDPMGSARLFLRKLYYFWSFTPHAGLLYPRSWMNPYKAYYFVLATLFLMGVYAGFGRASRMTRAALISMLSLMALVWLVHGLYYVEMRHRWSIEPFMTITAGYAVTRIANIIKTKRGDIFDAKS